jgi:signal transduction histidine kinase
MLGARDGDGFGRRIALPLGPLGALVLVAGDPPRRVVEALTQLAPVLRRRWTEERLADHATLLARRLESVEDFAALVAHELKGPLQAAVLAGDPAAGAAQAIALVDSILEVARTERASDRSASPAAALEQALEDLGGVAAEVVTLLPETFPLPYPALRIVLRNLVANAVAAGAAEIRVTAVTDGDEWTLLVDDDGAGLDASSYAAGSRLGLGLCSRLVERLGGSLELRARPARGTRAALRVPEVRR